MKKRMLIATMVFLASIVFRGMASAKDPYIVGYQTDFTGPGSVNYSPVAGFRVTWKPWAGSINGHSGDLGTIKPIQPVQVQWRQFILEDEFGHCRPQLYPSCGL
jgi:hypothetical protein